MEGHAQHGKERAHHHKSLQRGLSERREPRAMLHTQKACHTDRRASTSKEPNTHTHNSRGLPPVRNRTHAPNSPGQHTCEHNVEGCLKLCYDTPPQDRCLACWSGTFCIPSGHVHSCLICPDLPGRRGCYRMCLVQAHPLQAQGILHTLMRSLGATRPSLARKRGAAC
jgi:hypothetical protein